MQSIKPLSPSEGLSRWKVATLDIETRSIGGSALLGEYCIGATCIDGMHVSYHPTAIAMIDTIIRHGDDYRWFAHNGAGFDFKYFVEPEVLTHLTSRGWLIEIVGGSTAKGLFLRKGKTRIVICDSYKLLSQSLTALCKGFSTPIPKGFIDFEATHFDVNNREHLSYLAADVKALHYIVSSYRSKVLEYFHADIGLTASSTAYRAWRVSMHGKSDRVAGERNDEVAAIYKPSDACNSFCREAYYGGRTEIYYQGEIKDAVYIDCNSMYAYVMREYGGIVNPVYVDEYSEARPGIYRCMVHVPEDMRYCPFPYRTASGGLSFPRGSFETYLTTPEIETGRLLNCYVGVKEGYVFDHIPDMFTSFVNRCERMRSEDYNGAVGQTAKFLQNNLYGYFGMRTERDEMICSIDAPAGEEWRPYVDEESGNVHWSLWVRQVTVDNANCIPSIAAWITANARMHLYRCMQDEMLWGGNQVLYVDTDSMILTGEPSSIIGTEYGEWKVEARFKKWIGVTAKTYRGDTDGDEVVMRCKGVPARLLKSQMFDEDKPSVVSFSQLHSLSRVMVGQGRGEEITRIMPTKASMSNRQQGEGWTVPITMV